MNCREVVRQLSDYLDGQLESALARELEQHLAACRDCRILVSTPRKTIEIYCNAEPQPLPSGIHQRLMEALRGKFRA